MSDRSALRLARWPVIVPFIVGDLLFVGLGAFYLHSLTPPFSIGQVAVGFLCVAAGAWLSTVPFLWDYQAALKLIEADTLTSTLAQLNNLEGVALNIGTATAAWQNAQEASTRSVEAARDVTDRITAEAKAFAEFLQKANDSEKAHLKLEVEKLRRGEGDWLQVTTHMLDHTYALRQAAVRAGQPGLIDQLTHFQNACRDAARRMGLAPFVPAPGDVFDANRHQLMDDTQPPADARVGEALATGYTYQGQLIRRAVVALQGAAPPAPPSPAPAPEPASDPLASMEAAADQALAGDAIPEEFVVVDPPSPEPVAQSNPPAAQSAPAPRAAEQDSLPL